MAAMEVAEVDTTTEIAHKMATTLKEADLLSSETMMRTEVIIDEEMVAMIDEEAAVTLVVAAMIEITIAKEVAETSIETEAGMETSMEEKIEAEALEAPDKDSMAVVKMVDHLVLEVVSTVAMKVTLLENVRVAIKTEAAATVVASGEVEREEITVIAVATDEIEMTEVALMVAQEVALGVEATGTEGAMQDRTMLLGLPQIKRQQDGTVHKVLQAQIQTGEKKRLHSECD